MEPQRLAHTNPPGFLLIYDKCLFLGLHNTSLSLLLPPGQAGDSAGSWRPGGFQVEESESVSRWRKTAASSLRATSESRELRSDVQTEVTFQTIRPESDVDHIGKWLASELQSGTI